MGMGREIMNKPSLITRMRRRLQNKQGQSTTEYVLILAIVVMLASKMKGRVDKIFGDSTSKMDKALREFDKE